ncbi:MAG: DUF3429 domain-containing protein [Burkholderiaceae bacterium]|jgi:hypothetical protein|nr:DUF3429 domain-containing protein [Burkholderiaceae bacterium]MCU0930064.1 DUF3429 domain-containing protein [Burkholderiaceae bacterium]
MDATLSVSGTTPRAALALGYAGLIPFAAGALAAWVLGDGARASAAFALAGYAAVIVSFLGGIHWGIGFLRGDAVRFVWGVVPSLVAWPALLMPPAAGLALLAAMLVVCYVVDRRVYPAYGLQRWLPLRLHLSSVAAACCAAGAIGVGR